MQRPINKDTEMHPLVRWQFRGGIPEAERKAFLFENVVDSTGRKYDIPVAVGILASNRQIYPSASAAPSRTSSRNGVTPSSIRCRRCSSKIRLPRDRGAGR